VYRTKTSTFGAVVHSTCQTSWFVICNYHLRLIWDLWKSNHSHL
jgi:hypothetical protein